MAGAHIDLLTREAELIRRLSPFDMAMVLTELQDHGWDEARRLLGMIARHKEYQYRPEELPYGVR
jgi:hypothetical protein